MDEKAQSALIDATWSVTQLPDASKLMQLISKPAT
jgi:hypothetical protein